MLLLCLTVCLIMMNMLCRGASIKGIERVYICQVCRCSEQLVSCSLDSDGIKRHQLVKLTKMKIIEALTNCKLNFFITIYCGNIELSAGTNYGQNRVFR